MKTNEYGTPLDRNGYAPSIVQDSTDRCCYLCYANGHGDPLNRHEIFGGAYRKKSKRLGLWVYLCHDRCHQGQSGVHNSTGKDIALKRAAQRAAMEQYGWDIDRFRQEFGKNYLEEEDG